VAFHFFSGNGGSGKTFTAQALTQHLLEQAGGGQDSDVCKVSIQALHRKTLVYCDDRVTSLDKGSVFLYYLKKKDDKLLTNCGVKGTVPFEHCN